MALSGDCPNCGVRTPGAGVDVDSNLCCIVCGRDLSDEVEEKCSDVAHRLIQVQRLRQVLKAYSILVELGSGMAGLILLEAEGALKRLVEMEEKRGRSSSEETLVQQLRRNLDSSEA